MSPLLNVIRDFKNVLPRYQIPQEQSIERLLEFHLRAPSTPTDADCRSLLQKYFKRYSVKSDKIEFRSFEVPDISKDSAEPTLWDFNPANPISKDHGSDIELRTQFFLERALHVFNQMYPNSALGTDSASQMPSPTVPEHIVHVTCTGYVSPSAPQRLVASRGWSTGVTHAYHMGCYAALPAIRIADGLVHSKLSFQKETQPSVDIVHTEMCGLHMNPVAHTPEQIVVQSLFADGHIKYSVSRPRGDGHEFIILGVREKIVPDSHSDMSWITAPWGLKMNLSTQVPAKIGLELRNFVLGLAEQCNLEWGDLLKNALFAVHPGGPKIIDEVKRVLELSEEQISHSRKILKSRGNMSSATLPHVWQSQLEEGLDRGTPVVSLAFGPGLTIFGSIFKTN